MQQSAALPNVGYQLWERLWVWGQLSWCGLDVLPFLFCEGLLSSVAAKHHFQVQNVVVLIHPCSTSRAKEIHVDSESVVCVQVHVGGLYSNALVCYLVQAFM